MGRVFLVDLEIQDRYCCRGCHNEGCQTHLALQSESFVYFTGPNETPGLFVNDCVNVIIEVPEEITLRRRGNRFTVAEFFCVKCCRLVGWKFIEAQNNYEKWTEGRFLLALTALMPWSGDQLEPLDELDNLQVIM